LIAVDIIRTLRRIVKCQEIHLIDT